MRLATLLAVAMLYASTGAFAVTFDGRDIPTDFAGSLKATQINPTNYGDTWGDGAGSEMDQLFVAKGTRSGMEGLYVGITGNLEPKTRGTANAYVILIEVGPGGSNSLTPKNGDPGVPGAISNLNGTILDVGFNPTCAITFNNWANTVYVDYVNLITNSGVYLGSQQVNSGQGQLQNALAGWLAFNNTNTVGVIGENTKTPEQNAIDAATAGTGMEAFLSWTDLGVDPWSPPASVKIMAFVDSASGYLSNQTLPGMGGGYDNLGFGGTSVDFSTIPGNQFATVDLSTSIAGTPTVDGAAIPTDFAGYLVATQDNYTQFGDRSGDEGSELDQLFATQTPTGIDLGITGNLENGGNFWLTFFEVGPGGTHVLEIPDGIGPQSGVLQGMRGTTFNNGFAPTHVLCMNIFDGTLWVDLTDLRNGTSRYLGHAPVNGGTGDLAEGDNPNGVTVAFDNTNHLGVTGTDAGAAATATTGAEIHLTWADLGGMSCGVKAMVLLTGNAGAVSNQALAPFSLGTTGFSTSPVDFSGQSINQFVTLPIALPPYVQVTFAEARAATYGSPVRLTNARVSAAFADEGKYFIQADSSPLALPVYDAVTSPGDGAVVNIDGFVCLVKGEKAIAACQTTIVQPAGSVVVKPYAMGCKALGGHSTGDIAGIPNGQGAPNVGTLVCLCGRVTSSDFTDVFYYLDDGSGIMDGTTHLDLFGNPVPNVGIRVSGPHFLFGGEMVRAVGLSSSFTTIDESNNKVVHPMVRMRTGDDTVTIPETP